MKFSVTALVAFAATVLAQPRFTNSNFAVEENKPFTLTWSGAVGPVTITLMTGPASNLQEVTVITSGETDNSFTFTPSDLPSGTYAFRISDSTDEPNYSESFEYVGTGEPLTTTSVTSTATRRSTSTSVTSTSSASTTSEASTTTLTTTSASNSTITSTSLSTTLTPTTTTTRTTQTTAPANSNNGQRFASPLALVLGTVAALLFFN